MSGSDRAVVTRPQLTPRGRAIRDAALKLFAERGYEATTTTEIGAAVGIRGPSLYKHVSSKQDLLVAIMLDAMDVLHDVHALAVAGVDDVADRLRRAVEAHVRFHTRHRLEAFVGNREIRSLDEVNRAAVVARRSSYERLIRGLIEEGVAASRFHVASVKLASYALLDLGMGVAAWYREDGDLSEDEIVYTYGRFALTLVGVAG